MYGYNENMAVYTAGIIVLFVENLCNDSVEGSLCCHIRICGKFKFCYQNAVFVFYEWNASAMNDFFYFAVLL